MEAKTLIHIDNDRMTFPGMYRMESGVSMSTGKSATMFVKSFRPTCCLIAALSTVKRLPLSNLACVSMDGGLILLLSLKAYIYLDQ